ncbi:MAG: hypothetical protein CMA81_08170 [Euryarchaeota archaeon]|nr:hypothetical protein [Euryarchaeota archaeon]|tara:strand:+ start:864 stop:1109 length:246 start_codon:yes stop_codon:yes gene_type:complete
MKFILIAMVFNLQPITYSDKATCEEARDLLRAEAPLGQAGNILCIPAGEEPVDNMDKMFDNFINLVIKLEELNQKKLTNKE